MEQAFLDFALHHDNVRYCLERLYSLSEERSRRIVEAAAGRIDISWIFHDLGSQQALLCSPQTVRELFLPSIRRIAEFARDSGIRICLHSDGAIREAIPDLVDAGVEVINPVQWRCDGMAREQSVDEFGDRVAFHGGMDNQVTLSSNGGTAVRLEVRENIDILGSQSGYILAPCHNAQPVTRPETLVAMYDEAHNDGAR